MMLIVLIVLYGQIDSDVSFRAVNGLRRFGLRNLIWSAHVRTFGLRNLICVGINKENTCLTQFRFCNDLIWPISHLI